MAEKLSITIALEGGKEIQKQLADIGEEGQKAFQKIAAEAAKTGGLKNLKPEEVTQKLKDMGITGVDALNKITAAVAQATKLESLVGVVQKIETGFANVGAAAAAFGRALGPIGIAAVAVGTVLVKSMNAAAEAINKADAAAIKAGISIEKFSQFKQGLEQAGFSTNAVASGIEKINSAMEQGKLKAVADAIKAIQERPGTGVGSGPWNVLTEAVKGVGPAADAAKKGILELGGTISDSGIKSLGELQQTTGSAEAGFKAFVTQLAGMTDITNRNALALRDLGTAAGTELVQGMNAGTISLKDNGASIDALVAKYPTLTQGLANTSTIIQEESNKMSASWKNLMESIGRQGLTSTADELRTLTTILDGINAALKPENWAAWGSAAVDAIVGIFTKLGELEVKLAQIIVDMAKALGAGLFGGGGGEPGSTTPIPGNAAGGLIGGRGTGTSDSNLAWVSRGEHIMPASVVRQPGVLALLEALRHGSGIGRFALGGVVPGLPRFADGGLVGHLGTVDLRTDHGSVRLMAGASAVDQLSRLAVTRRMTSTGRKPGFVG
jgi:hypothetical protein